MVFTLVVFAGMEVTHPERRRQELLVARGGHCSLGRAGARVLECSFHALSRF